MNLVVGELRVRRGTSAEWIDANPILSPGEPGYETDTRKMKLGDGSTAWVSLGYLTTTFDGPGTSDQALLAHINSTTPHPAYDTDISSLSALFENGLL